MMALTWELQPDSLCCSSACAHAALNDVNLLMVVVPGLVEKLQRSASHDARVVPYVRCSTDPSQLIYT